MTGAGVPAWMSVRRLDWALRTRGAEIEAWPDADRLAARALLRRSVKAREVFADALAREDAPPHECEVAARIVGVLRRSFVASTPLRTGMRWGALAACAVAGLYAGQAYLASQMQGDVFQVVQAAAVP